MAEKNDPFADFDTPDKGAGGDPFADFDTKDGAKPQSALEKGGSAGLENAKDVARIAAPSLYRGSLVAITAPRTISDLTGEGVNWAANKFAPQNVADAANKFHAWDTGMGGAFPSYDQLKSETEEWLGHPLATAQKPLGKGVQAGLEIAPSLLAGGEGVLPTITKSIGAAVGSGTLGEIASYLKGKFPSSVPDWLEPVARGVGAIPGTMLPAGIRSRLTPNPITDPAHAAAVRDLEANNPAITKGATAGQYTNTPKLMESEGRASKFANQPQAQEQILTNEAMKTAGGSGQATPQALSDLGGKNPNVQGIGQQIGAIRTANEINPIEFPGLNTELENIKRGHAAIVGKQNAQNVADIQNEIRLGAQNSPNNASMQGPRYAYMRKRLQKGIDEGGPDQMALSGFRDALDRAFHRSISPQDSARLKELEQNYTNYQAIANRSNPQGKTTMDPAELRAAASGHFGNVSANTNSDQLSRLADTSAKVMQPLPPRSTEAPDVVHLLGSLTGALTHGGVAAGAVAGAGGGFWPAVGAGLTGAGEGTLTGLFQAPHIYNAARDMAARLRATGPAQKYLRNQAFMPGNPAFMNDPKTVARLLLTPPERQAVSGDQQ